MRKMLSLLAILLVVGFAAPAGADYVKISRRSSVRGQPQASAMVLFVAEPGEFYRLLEATQTSGYYHVHAYSGGRAGWVYRTFVRRYTGDPPEATLPAVSGGGPVGSPTAGGTAALADASAFPIQNCPPEGNAKKASVTLSNPLKNRIHAPDASKIQSTTLEAFLAPGDDHDRWSQDQGTEVVGWVMEVKSGGAETCNCRSTNHDDWDTHIELVKDPAEKDGKKTMIVEVTPQWRRLMASVGKDWSTTTLQNTIKGRQIRVRGWLFFDAEHEHQAQNTEPDGDRNWRGTAWEVHPITSLEVIDGVVH